MTELDQQDALQRATRIAGVPLTVSQLNSITRSLLERALPALWVSGEISNYTRAASGHCYFSLKDAQAQVRCVMFRHRLTLLDWSPSNGAHVEVRALPSLYEARGEFQLNVEFMRRAGVGLLFERFTRLKTQLEAEGLFDVRRKKPLPSFPLCVGLVTSTAGAALRDVLTTLRRRMPAISVVIYPTPVQGDGAAAQIAAAINTASERAECDVMILCRGGGSLEDLWAFNEEPVARAIAACRLPLVSGVGHETDFTIADFVADIRAPTPTAAAELVSPDAMQLTQRLQAIAQRLRRAGLGALERRMQQADYLARRLVHPGERIAGQRRYIDVLQPRLRAASHRALQTRHWRLERQAQRIRASLPRIDLLRQSVAALGRRLQRAHRLRLGAWGQQLERLATHLAHLDPRQVLARGYAIVTTPDGTVVYAAAQLAAGERVEVLLGQGSIEAEVVQVRQ